jgi:hypothetical protein
MIRFNKKFWEELRQSLAKTFTQEIPASCGKAKPPQEPFVA